MKKLFFISCALAFVSSNAYSAGNATAGKTKYQICATCHGANGEGNEAQKAPKIAGQLPWYLKSSLKKFMEGKRGAANSGDTEALSMAAMAKTLVNDQGIDDVVAYIQCFSAKPDEKTKLGCPK